MVGVIDGFRWSVTGVSSFFYWPGFLVSLGLVLLVTTGGIWYFRKTERAFADVI
jgi:lipopolysaccharide transport system permease protein